MREESLESRFDRFRRIGDTGALASVFDETAPELLAVARHLTTDRSEGEDLLQSTFLTAIERADQFEVERRLKPWLIGILAHHAANARRRASRAIDPQRLTLSPPADPSGAVLDQELRAELMHAVDALPPTYREVLLPRMRGEANQTIARRVGREPGVVRMQITRGLRLLRRALPAGLASSVTLAAGTRSSLAAVRGHVLEQARLLSVAKVSAGAPPAAIALGGALVSKKIAASVFVAVSALVAITAWLMQGDDDRRSPPQLPAERAAASPPRPSSTPPPDRASERMVAPAAESPPAPDDSSSPPASYRRHLAGVQGRILAAGGDPLEACPVTLLELAPDHVVTPVDAGFRAAAELPIEIGTALTDTEGRFLIRGAQPRGVHALGIDLGGPRGTFRVLAQDLGVAELRDVGDIVLDPCVTFRGRVIDEDAAPIEGARVRTIPLPLPLQMVGAEHVRRDSVAIVPMRRSVGVIEIPAWAARWIDRLPIPTTHTDADGRFELDGVPLGLITTVIDHETHVARVVGPTPSGRDGRDLGEVTLEDGRSVTGRVVDGEGEPIAHAEVAAGVVPLFDEMIPARKVMAGEDGRFAFHHLPYDGAVAVAARATAIDAWSMPTPQDVEEIEVVLPTRGWLTLRVLGPKDAPVLGVDARVAPWSPIDRLANHYLGYPQATVTPVEDEAGTYRMGPLSAGRYNLIVRADGYVPRFEGVEMQAQDEEMEICLTPGETRHVQVVDDETGRPVEYALVSLIDRANKDLPLVQARTDAAGRVALGPSPLKPLLARVAHPGYPTVAAPLPRSEDEEAVILLPAAGALEGKLVADGALPDEYIIALNGDATELDIDECPYFAVTDRLGAFHFTRLAPGTYDLEVYPNRFSGSPFQIDLNEIEEIDRPLARAEVTIQAGEVTRHEIAFFAPGMATACTLTGVLRLDGQPVTSGLVSINQARYLSAETDANGRFRLTDLAPGPAKLVARVWNPRVSHDREIVLSPAEHRDLTIDLSSHRVTFTVRREDGGSTKGLRVFAERVGGAGGNASATVDESGNATALFGDPGTYTASVSDPTHGADETTFEVPCQEPVALTVHSGVACAGTFTLAEDLPLELSRGVNLLIGNVRDGEEVRYRWHALSPNETSFRVTGLSPGRYECRLMDLGLLSKPIRFDLPEEGNEQLAFHFEAAEL